MKEIVSHGIIDHSMLRTGTACEKEDDEKAKYGTETDLQRSMLKTGLEFMSHGMVFRLITLQAVGMSTPMILRTAYCAFSAASVMLLLFPSVLIARADRLLVLPFRVSGRAPAAYFDESELPARSMQAALFLTQLLREYRAIPCRESLSDCRQGLDERALENRLGAFCSDPSVSHVLGGHLLFTGSSELTVEIFTASCVRRSILYTDRSSGNINEIQTLMRKSIFRSTPFLPENRSFARLQNFDGMQDQHLHVIADLSGSMELTLPFVRRALENLEISPQSTVTFTTISNADHIDHTEAFTDPAPYLKTVRSLHGSGTTTEASLLDGLRRAADHMKPGTARMLVFTDASFSERGLLQLQEIFRRYRGSGIDIAFFPGYASDPAFLDRTSRFDRIARIYTPVFARRGSFVTGESYFFVRRGSAFFLCPGDAGEDIASGRLNTSRCQNFPAHRYSREELDLDRIVQAYAQRNNLKVNDISPVYSDLEFRIADFLTDRTGSRAPYRVLVQNGNRAFWIGLTQRDDYQALSRKKGEKLYIGLHLRATPGGIENIPAKIYMLPDAEVPGLFILDYEKLLRLNRSYWNVRDAWFFHVEVRDYRHE
jgi:hypothetical protein